MHELTFRTGHRCYLRDVSVFKTIKGNLILRLIRVPFGPHVTKQYYAYAGDHFDLVRLEDFERQCRAELILHKAFPMWARRAKQGEVDWEADLLSTDRLKVLRALVWLGGVHSTPKDGNKPEVYIRLQAILISSQESECGKKLLID